jgi:RNA polymerase sigma-70 factor (ECF subfamily)
MTDDEKSKEFLKIFEDNIGIILGISRAFITNYRDREDLINDIAFELWKSFKSFKGNSKISTWIYRVALNTAMNYKRKEKKNSLFIRLSDSGKEGVHWLTEQDNSTIPEILYQCIEELDELNKAIILLYLDGNSHDEIAEITGITLTNVGTRIGRIKEQLKCSAIKKI